MQVRKIPSDKYLGYLCTPSPQPQKVVQPVKIPLVPNYDICDVMTFWHRLHDD